MTRRKRGAATTTALLVRALSQKYADSVLIVVVTSPSQLRPGQVGGKISPEAFLFFWAAYVAGNVRP